LGRRVEIVGESGQSYAFTRVEGDSHLRAVGATYLIAEPANGGWRVLYAGETSNVADASWRSTLDAVRAAHPKAECLIRLNVARSVREAEIADIVQRHAPPRNG
jgi:hypothetical protein